MNLVMTFWTLVLLRRTRTLPILATKTKEKEARKQQDISPPRRKGRRWKLVSVGWQFKDNFVFQVGAQKGRWEKGKIKGRQTMHVWTYLGMYMYACTADADADADADVDVGRYPVTLPQVGR
ncbi:hypothetical protein LY76DRAFT_125856 [Colletotrichum caudatum]|nr:hypothetical protein LY76DRAFT_125856 [Colletotrichum caudatum]